METLTLIGKKSLETWKNEKKYKRQKYKTKPEAVLFP